jgi:murein DD-endopeptidase MepM/ murein hydrolase activator NlpD
VVDFNVILRIGLISLLIICIGVLVCPVRADVEEVEPQTAGIAADTDVGFFSLPLSENGAKGGAASQDELEASPDGGMMAATAEPDEFSKPKMLLYTTYEVKQGDTVSGIAQQFALEWGTILSVNNIKNAKGLQIGQRLKIPNQDGVLVSGKKNQSLLDFIAETGKEKKYEGIPTDGEGKGRLMASIQAANELFTDKFLSATNPKPVVFIPGVKMTSNEMREITGDVFTWPLTIRGWPTDSYGWRVNPFTGGGREFHNGMDISAGAGTPIRAAMAGQVIFAGWSDSYGNYVVIRHSGGYRTLYAHMRRIHTTSGAYVGAGERIGEVGSTGRSTGPHLHFTVYKNGTTVNPRLLLR